MTCTPESLIGRAPLRRLTRFEYDNTVAALLGDTTSPARSLPPELLGNGFGNDADAQPVSSFLAEQYGIVAGEVARRAVELPDVIGTYAPCFDGATSVDADACARTFIENFAPEAYRRPLSVDELDELAQLQAEISGLTDFRTSIASVIEAILQSPDFLYRIEVGEPTEVSSSGLRPTGHEMASRLSYFLWGSPPDAELQRAAAAGELADTSQVSRQAARLLDDPRARPVLRFFFGRFLPIEGLTDLARDPEQYPTFSPEIGALMRQETETFLEYEIFEGPGDWRSALTAPYTFMNETLAAYYGTEGVVGDHFQKVAVDPTERKGLLTHGSILTGTTVSNYTNPVRRGVFLLRNLMCIELPDPPEALAENIVPPDPTSGSTGRERYAAHSQQAACAACHRIMDPPGFALENYDAVGQWREQENGVTIDASGQIPSLPTPFAGPLELVQVIADAPETQACFAQKWLSYASGRSLTEQDACLIHELEQNFIASGYNIKQLLVDLTQTEAFLQLPPRESL